LTPAELSRMDYRFGLFQRRGMESVKAATLAHALVKRDAQEDDRRLCIECRHYRQSGTCTKGLAQLRMTPQRCTSFDWMTQ
jgi:hypothetical protein